MYVFTYIAVRATWLGGRVRRHTFPQYEYRGSCYIGAPSATQGRPMDQVAIAPAPPTAEVRVVLCKKRWLPGLGGPRICVAWRMGCSPLFGIWELGNMGVIEPMERTSLRMIANPS